MSFYLQEYVLKTETEEQVQVVLVQLRVKVGKKFHHTYKQVKKVK